MSVRAAEHLAVQHPRQVHVGTIKRLARHFIVAIVPNRARAYYIKFLSRKNYIRCHLRLDLRKGCIADYFLAYCNINW